MANIAEYIPEEIFREAKDFIRIMDESVEIYKTIRRLNTITPSFEADSFASYWTISAYNSFPHALITLYEYTEKIDKNMGLVNADNAFECLKYKMESYYKALKENNLIKI